MEGWAVSYEFVPSIPFYYQIKEDILHKIESGVYAVHQQLESEIQLAEHYGVSRPTMRQAIAELVQEGVLVRGRGKGTFVCKPMITDNAQVFTTFAQPEDGEQKHVTKVMNVRRVHAAANMARDLGIARDADVVEVLLVQMSSDEKLAIRILQIPLELAPELDRYDAERESGDSIYEFLQSRYGLVPAAALQSFQCVAATEEESALLEIEVGSHLMMWQGIVYSRQNRPIFRVKTLFRGDRFKFYISQGKRSSELSDFIPSDRAILEEF